MSDQVLLLEELTPTPEDLASYKGLENVDELDAPVESIAAHLQLAAAMFLLASEATVLPDKYSPLGIVLKNGILDMAWYIGTSMEDRDAMFSPFSSERIGSYSYSKASKSAMSGESTGVPFFDMALQWFSRGQDSEDYGDLFGMHSEHVFRQPFARRYQQSSPLLTGIPVPDSDEDEEDDDAGGSGIDYVSLFEEGR